MKDQIPPAEPIMHLTPVTNASGLREDVLRGGRGAVSLASGLQCDDTMADALAAMTTLREQRDYAHIQLEREEGRRKAAESELEEANAWFEAWPGKGNPAPIDEVLARKMEHVADQAELAGLRLGVQQSASGEADTALTRIRAIIDTPDANWQEITDAVERRAGLRRRMLAALRIDIMTPNDEAERIAADTYRRADLWDRRAETMDLEAIRAAVRRMASSAFFDGEDTRAAELRSVLNLLADLS